MGHFRFHFGFSLRGVAKVLMSEIQAMLQQPYSFTFTSETLTGNADGLLNSHILDTSSPPNQPIIHLQILHPPLNLPPQHTRRQPRQLSPKIIPRTRRKSQTPTNMQQLHAIQRLYASLLRKLRSQIPERYPPPLFKLRPIRLYLLRYPTRPRHNTRQSNNHQRRKLPTDKQHQSEHRHTLDIVPIAC